MVHLGDLVRDKVTGFQGVATGRFEYLSGCLRISVESTDLQGGKAVDATFDEDRLEVVTPGYVAHSQDAAVRLGGPRDTPRRDSPQR